MGDGNGPADHTTRAMRRHLHVVAAITALGGSLFGYDTGVVSGALLCLHRSFGPVSSFGKQLVTSLLLVGAMVGALGAGRVADCIGRRPTLLGSAVVFVVGVLAAALSPSLGVLIAMRFVIALAVGQRPRPSRCSSARWRRRTCADRW